MSTVQENDPNIIWLECGVYVSFAVACTAIVLYFRFKSGNSFREYMLGDGSLGLIPITLSMIASTVSHGSIMSMFEESYLYGAQYILYVLWTPFACVVSTRVFIPLFYSLKLVSPYETLTTASLIYSLSRFIQQIVKVEVYTIQIAVGAIGTIYTTLGGFKGVVWTDALQAIIVFITMIFLLVVAIINSGGLWSIYQPYYESGRFEIKFDFDPTIRVTFWSATISKFATQLYHSPLRPDYCQRLASLEDERLAKWVNVIEVIVHSTIRVMATALGVVAYARYEGCDPVSAGFVERYMQLPLYYALDVGRKLKVTQCIVILGVLSAGLSSLSTSLNTIPFVFYKDIFTKLRKSPKEFSSKIIKIMIFIFGTITCLLSLAFKSAVSINELYAVIVSTINLNTSVFLVGIFVPFINATGVLWGAVTSVVLLIWMSIGSRLAAAQGRLVHPTKMLRTDECPFNVTINPKLTSSGSDLFYLYRISPFHYATVGLLSLLTVSTIVSWMTRSKVKGGKDLRRVVWPGVHRFMPTYDAVSLSERK